MYFKFYCCCQSINTHTFIQLLLLLKMGQSFSKEEMKVCEGEQFQRIEGENVHQNPYRSIVAFRCKSYLGKPCYASGTLISKNLILTSAHTIYNRKQKRVNENFQFYCEVDGVTSKYYHRMEGWRYSPQFQQSEGEQKLKLDYALIKIKENQRIPINNNDFPKILLTCQKCMKKDNSLRLDIFGYPADHMSNFRLLEEGGMRLYQYGFSLRERIQAIDHKAFTIKYKINTEVGQSGCPIIINKDIIGVHNGSVSKQKINIGRLITSDLVDNILKWSKQLNGDPITIKYNSQCCKKLSNPLPQPKPQIKKQDPKPFIKKQLQIKKESPEPFNKQYKPAPLEIKKEQEKTMQIRQKQLSDILKKIKSIPAQEKKQITSLILKATVTILQKKCIIIIIEDVISNQ